MIHSDSVNDVYSKRNTALWLISAFKAGFINSAGFLITGKFVSHVTGFGTQVGIALGHHEYFFGAELLIIPVSFILGGVVTSFVLDRDYSTGETPPYWKVQTLITGLLILLILLGENLLNSAKAPFDTDENYNVLEFSIIALLCFVCGLKNSLVTWSTFGRIRVTHLTGLSTDIGLHLLRTLGWKQKSPRFQESRFINVLRILTFLFFSFGALISAVLYPDLGFKGFFIPLIISISMSLISIWDCRRRLVLA
jgi:uncharacterized membrane protein YoaK (UPF0700 family)